MASYTCPHANPPHPIVSDILWVNGVFLRPHSIKLYSRIICEYSAKIAKEAAVAYPSTTQHWPGENGKTPHKSQSGQLMLWPRLEPAHAEKFTALAGRYNFICSAFLNIRKCSSAFYTMRHLHATFILAQGCPSRGNICKLCTRGVPKIPGNLPGWVPPFQKQRKRFTSICVGKNVKFRGTAEQLVETNP